MELLANILATEPAAPRVTVYNEDTGARLDFSGITLDNWAAKVANMLREESGLDAGATICIDLPPSWQSIVIALGALAAGITPHFGATSDHPESEALFVTPDHTVSGDVDTYLVTDDPFGRGVEECGATLPDGAIDFAPTVRFYGDQFFEPTPRIQDLTATNPLQPNTRIISRGWTDLDGFTHASTPSLPAAQQSSSQAPPPPSVSTPSAPPKKSAHETSNAAPVGQAEPAAPN